MPPKADDIADESLIELVKRHSALYDYHHKDFKNLHVREDLWIEIAAMLDKDVQSCKKRWRDIRDNYYKIRRKEQKNFSWGYKVKQSKWRLYDHLQFLPVVQRAASTACAVSNYAHDDTAASIASSSNNADESSNHDEDARCPSPEVILTHSEVTSDWELFASEQKRRYGHDKADEPPLPTGEDDYPACELQLATKRMRTADCGSGDTQQQDDVDLFMRSVAISVKKLLPQQIAKAKMEILSIVTRLQFPTENTT